MNISFNNFIKKTKGLSKFIEKHPWDKETPIPNEYLKALPNNEITITESVFEELMKLADKTNSTGCEQSFILYAANSSVIRYYSCNIAMCVSSNTTLHQRQAHYDKNLLDFLDTISKKVKNNQIAPGGIVFIGHTHPAIGIWYENFSYGDLNGYIKNIENQKNPIYRNEIVRMAGCMLTSDKQLNIIFYNPKTQDFYRIQNIFVKTKNGKKIPFNQMVRKNKKQKISTIKERLLALQQKILNCTNKKTNKKINKIQ